MNTIIVFAIFIGVVWFLVREKKKPKKNSQISIHETIISIKRGKDKS